MRPVTGAIFRVVVVRVAVELGATCDLQYKNLRSTNTGPPVVGAPRPGRLVKLVRRAREQSTSPSTSSVLGGPTSKSFARLRRALISYDPQTARLNFLYDLRNRGPNRLRIS